MENVVILGTGPAGLSAPDAWQPWTHRSTWKQTQNKEKKHVTYEP